MTIAQRNGLISTAFAGDGQLQVQQVTASSDGPAGPKDRHGKAPVPTAKVHHGRAKTLPGNRSRLYCPPQGNRG